jgi:hypothetical protein
MGGAQWAGVPAIYAQAHRLRCPRSASSSTTPVGSSIDRGSEAPRLGRTSVHLFGLDPVKPLARYDRMGLFWVLKGESVLKLSLFGRT